MTVTSKWLPIPGYPGREVSNFGAVYSQCARPARVIEGTVNTTGHTMYCLSYRGVSKVYNAGTLVLMAFVGPCPEDHECCHNDGDPTNNCLDNLRWGTRKENIADAVTHGTHNCTRTHENHIRAKLTNAQVRSIREQVTAGVTQAALGRLYGVTISCINNIIRGKTWSTL